MAEVTKRTFFALTYSTAAIFLAIFNGLALADKRRILLEEHECDVAASTLLAFIVWVLVCSTMACVAQSFCKASATGTRVLSQLLKLWGFIVGPAGAVVALGVHAATGSDCDDDRIVFYGYLDVVVALLAIPLGLYLSCTSGLKSDTDKPMKRLEYSHVDLEAGPAGDSKVPVSSAPPAPRAAAAAAARSPSSSSSSESEAEAEAADNSPRRLPNSTVVMVQPRSPETSVDESPNPSPTTVGSTRSQAGPSVSPRTAPITHSFPTTTVARPYVSGSSSDGSDSPASHHSSGSIPVVTPLTVRGESATPTLPSAADAPRAPSAASQHSAVSAVSSTRSAVSNTLQALDTSAVEEDDEVNAAFGTGDTDADNVPLIVSDDDSDLASEAGDDLVDDDDSASDSGSDSGDDVTTLMGVGSPAAAAGKPKKAKKKAGGKKKAGTKKTKTPKAGAKKAKTPTATKTRSASKGKPAKAKTPKAAGKKTPKRATKKAGGKKTSKK